MTISVELISKLSLLFIVLMVNPWYHYHLNIDIVYVFLFLILTTLHLHKFGFNISKNFFLLVSIFLIVFILQWMKYGLLPIFTIFGFFIRIMCAYYIVKLLRNFLHSFVNVVFILSCVSLFLWFFEAFTPLQVSSLFFTEAYANETSIKPDYLSPIYTSKTEFYLDSLIKRNAGFAWEPSAFASINIIAILLDLL